MTARVMDAAGQGPYTLERFVMAQNFGDTFGSALREVRSGHKTSHWMWFVFPQIEGLGHSWMARKYAIESLDEAREYLRHPLLGTRLAEISAATAEVASPESGRTADGIFGAIDALKLRSSMTLFAIASTGAEGAEGSEQDAADSGASTIFDRVIDVCFEGKRDEATEQILHRVPHR